MMTLKTLGLTLTCLTLAVLPLQGASAASDNILTLSLQDLAAHPDYAAKVPTDIKFFYGNQPAKAVKVLGPVSVTRKSAKKYSDRPGSCRWAMFSALIGLAEEARLQGGNAVINIKSNFANVETSSETDFRCGVGNMMVGVALKGEIAVVE
jgi:hypothetical protein